MGIEMLLKTKVNIKIFGTDFSELMYKQAISRNQKYVDNGIVNLEFGDFLLKDYAEQFDKVFCINVVYFMKDLNSAFSKIYKMVNTGGRFCIFMYDEKFIEQLNFNNFYKYSIDTVEQKLLEAGFKSVDYKFEGGYFIKAYK
jgi:SAM-dependent methyltransferase